jgi:hypothetical protein
MESSSDEGAHEEEDESPSELKASSQIYTMLKQINTNEP